jgi:hypothetical protein
MPSLVLALEDFVPVILTAIGLRFVVRMVGLADRAAGRWAALGATLIVAGGLSRATWKTILAIGGPDIAALFVALYALLAIGYLLLAMAIWHARQLANDPPSGVVRIPVWAPAGVALLVLLPLTMALVPTGGRGLPVLWLLAATIGSVSTSVLLARWARGAGRPGIGWLFIASILVTLGLNGLARVGDQSEALQWVEQLLNTLNQAFFLAAAMRLDSVVRGDAVHLKTRYGV